MKDYLVVIMIMSVALAMDAFAVAITLGMNGSAHRIRDRLKVSASFGFFQGLLFIIGIISLKFISGEVTAYNRLIAGVILLILGVRMLKEAFEEPELEQEIEKNKRKDLSFKLLAMFGIATSIDALAAGITYGLIYNKLILATVLISGVAFVFSYIGSSFGKKLGHIIGNKATIFGGIIIILLGIDTLFF